MQTLLLISGIGAWICVGLVLAAGTIRKLLGAAPVKRRLHEPRFAAYNWFAKYRIAGFVMNRKYRGKVPADVITAHQEVKLSEMQTLRDVYKEIDGLPTIQKGKAALGLKSVFEIPLKRVHRIPSPYTHPLQYPPFYLPGVPARMFYDPKEFEWTRPLEEAYPIIKEELLGILAAQGAGFKGYMSENQQRLGGWNTYNFFFYGKKFEENCARCPRTTAILESLPRFERDHIMFSALNPHSRIPPHVGPMNGIVRAHLPLIVPDGCYIRVGSEERTWHEGKLLAFDDSFEHEVFNHGDGVRIVLFMNFWHPCFRAEEIPVLERFRRAYEASPLSRVHERNQTALGKHDMASAKVVAAA
jgi:hypothetical protein